MAKEKEQSFEENLEELEVIVKKLESGEVPLDEAIDKFNEAMKLAKKCNEKLKAAEESVNKVLTENGELKDFKLEDE